MAESEVLKEREKNERIVDMEGLNSQPEQNAEKAEGVEEFVPVKIELSPEQTEVVMAKIQDINKPETGLHAIHASYDSFYERLELFKKDMAEGILGRPDGAPSNGALEINKNEWVNQVKKRKGVHLFFNMVGREIKSVDQSFWANRTRKDPICIIFDTNNFKEVDINNFIYNYDKEPDKSVPAQDRYLTKTFGRHGTSGLKIKVEKPTSSGYYREIKIPQYDMGYALNFRVSPRFFKGVLFRVDRKITEEDAKRIIEQAKDRLQKKREEDVKIYGEDWVLRYPSFYEEKRGFQQVMKDCGGIIEDIDENHIQDRVSDIVGRMLEACAGREDRLVPVYDMHGNMWWPKKIPYGKIQEIVYKD